MLQAISEGSQKLGQAGTAAASIDRLSPEQRNKIKELERQQALGLLGLDAGQQQRILSQQLQPVQTAEREAFNRQAQGQMIGDVGQGATFRGQQALLEGASRARTQATSAAQQQIAELDELAKARQLNEMAQLKQQQQQNRMATAQLVAGIVGGGTEIAAGIVGRKEIAAHQKEEREIALLNARSRAALEKKTLNKVSDTPTSSTDYFESLERFVTPVATPPPPPPIATTPPPQMLSGIVGEYNNPALDAMVSEGRMTLEEAASIRQFMTSPSSADMLFPETVQIPVKWSDKAAIVTQDPLTKKTLQVKVGTRTWTPTTSSKEDWIQILEDIGRSE